MFDEAFYCKYFSNDSSGIHLHFFQKDNFNDKFKPTIVVEFVGVLTKNIDASLTLVFQATRNIELNHKTFKLQIVIYLKIGV